MNAFLLPTSQRWQKRFACAKTVRCRANIRHRSRSKAPKNLLRKKQRPIYNPGGFAFDSAAAGPLLLNLAYVSAAPAAARAYLRAGSADACRGAGWPKDTTYMHGGQIIGVGRRRACVFDARVRSLMEYHTPVFLVERSAFCARWAWSHDHLSGVDVHYPPVRPQEGGWCSIRH